MSLYLSFLSLVDALFLLCPWFSHEVFYTVMSFNEPSKDTGFSMFFSLLLLVAVLDFYFFSFSPAVGGIRFC